MDPLTPDTLRTLAKVQGLDLTDQELASLTALVQANRSMFDSLRDALSPDVEPSSHYRMF